jgi:Zn-dependent peptidase ImmA (M78 family)/transcriptional regulator with XRE-family HTH domain
MDKHHIAKKIKQFAQLRRLSQKEIANTLEMSPQLVNSVFNARKETSSKTIVAIAELLKLPLHLLEANVPNFDVKNRAFRRSASTTQADRLYVESIEQYVLQLVSVLESFFEFPSPNLPSVNLDLARKNNSVEETISTVANDLRHHWGLGDGVIDNLTLLLENNGIICISPDGDFKQIEALSFYTNDFGSKQTAFILCSGSASKTAARQRFDLAHELGHLILHQDIDWHKYHIDKQFYQTIENEANLFASNFLMPETSIRGAFQQSVDLSVLLAIKKQWGVSMQTLIIRSEQLGFIDANRKTSLFIQLSQRGWRKSEPLDNLVPLEKPVIIRELLQSILFDNKLITLENLEKTCGCSLEDLEAIAGLPSNFLKYPVFTPVFKLKDPLLEEGESLN